jgi:hypothetical protein
LGALAALGLAACDPAAPASSAPASNPASSQPAASSKPAESSKPASSKPASSTPASSSQPAVETDPFKKATGHSVKNYQDVPGDTEKGTAAYKMGLCDDNDGFSAIRVNQSAVTYPSGSKRKDGTPEGYTKLNGDGQKMTFKIEVAKGYTGKLYLFGVMDNWSSNTGSSFFYNGAPNTKIEVNGVSIDCSAQNGKTYLDYFGDGQGEGTLSPEGYAEFGSCTLKPGVNEIVYTRVATLNMLVKDFVFVGQEVQEWTTTEVAATEGKVGYKKSVNNFDGSVKIEIKALDGAMASGSSNKNGTPEGYLKLDGNGNKIGYTFDFGENLDGKFYQRGMMDNYSDTNVNCTYYSKSTTGNGDKRGNFKVTVNGNAIYLGDKKDITYSTMLGAETQEIGGKTYSKVADCEIGDAFIKNGENYIEFERIDSFNLSISEFVFIGRSASAHAALDETAVWKMDENTHWKEMPNDTFKWNRAENVWVADTEHASTPATCSTPGKSYEVEAESGLTREVDLPIDPNAHSFVDGQKVADVTPGECACGDKGYTMLKADAEGDNDTSKKMGKNGKLSTYDITGAIPAGTYDLFFLGKTDSNTDYDFLTRYVVYFGEDTTENNIAPDAGTYASYGWSSSGEKWTNKKVATVTVPENATSFTLKYIGSGFSCFINGMRLVSHHAEPAAE